MLEESYNNGCQKKENTFGPGGGGILYIFWVRGRAIGKGIDFHEFGIRNGIDFCNFRNWYRVGYAFSENWYKVGYIFF